MQEVLYPTDFTWKFNVAITIFPIVWGRSNQYDGVEEFWVDTRTTGLQSYAEKEVEQDQQTKERLSEEPILAQYFGVQTSNHCSANYI